MLASAGDDAVVRLRDLASGRLVGRLEGHADAVSCLAFSPDGSTLATGSYDRTVKLWDVATRSLKTTLTGHINWVFSVAFAPDGRSLASGGHDKTVRIWDVMSGRETASLVGHSASVRAVAFAPGNDQSLLASGGADQLVLVWDLRTGTLRARLEGHKGMVRALSFAPDGATLATGGEDGEVRLWETRSQARLRAALAGHSDMVTCLAFSPRGGNLRRPAAWMPASSCGETELGPGSGHHCKVTSTESRPLPSRRTPARWPPAASTVPSASGTPPAPIFSPAACLAYPGEPQSLAFAPDSRSLRAAGTAGVVRWDVRAGSAFPRTGNDHATAVAAALDGTRYATGGPAGKVVLYDALSDERLDTLEGHSAHVQSIAFSANSRLIASGDHDGVVHLWAASEGRSLGSFPALQRPITCVQFSRDGRILAAATGDDHESSPGNVTLWDVTNRRVLGTLECHASVALSVAFSPDGLTIATAGADGLIRLWDTATRSPRDSLEVLTAAWRWHSRPMVAFSRQRIKAATSFSGTPSERPRSLVLLGSATHDQAVGQVIFSPDGRLLATAGKDQTVKLWSLATRRPADGTSDPQAGSQFRRDRSRYSSPTAKRPRRSPTRRERHRWHHHALGPGHEEAEDGSARARPQRCLRRVLAGRHEPRLGKLRRHDPDLGSRDRQLPP